MNYFKNNNNEVFAYDGEQIAQGYGKDLTQLESGEFFDGSYIKPYKLDDSYVAVERDVDGNIIAPQTYIDYLIEETAEQKKASERQWRDSELSRADIEIYKLEDINGDTSEWRVYRMKLRTYPETSDFPNGTRPTAPDVVEEIV